MSGIMMLGHFGVKMLDRGRRRPRFQPLDARAARTGFTMGGRGSAG
jgi:hypothetical protein